MKRFIFLLSFALLGLSANAQVDNTIDKGSGWLYFSGVPGSTPNISTGAEVAINILTREAYVWNRDSTAWKLWYNFTQDDGSPSGDPGTGPKLYLNVATGELWRWDGANWVQYAAGNLADGDYFDIDVSGSGLIWNIDTATVGAVELSSTGVTPGSYTLSSVTVDQDGRITTIASGSEVDGSVSNEGSLTVTAGTGTTSVINSNTSGSTPVTLSAGSGVTLAESGNTITITASGTDDQKIDTFTRNGFVISLSLENDGEAAKTVDLAPILDTIDNQTLLWNAATQQITISGGNTIDLTEGLEDMVADMFLNGSHTNIVFTYDDITGTIDVVASGGGGSGVGEANVGLNLGTGAEVYAGKVDTTLQFRTLVNGGIVSITEGTNDITITATEVDGSVTNEGSLTVAAGTASTSVINSNTSGSTGVTLSVGAGLSISESGNTITITNTGDTNAADDLTTSTSFSGDVSGLYNNLQLGTGVVGTGEVADNTLTATDLSVNVVSSVDGVVNDGGNIDLIAGSNITITPDDALNTITIASTQLTEEQVEDFVGGMVTGNTETGISVTYDDPTGVLNFVTTDQSTTNEGSLTVGAGTDSTSLIQSNTSGSTPITLLEGTGIQLTESGNTITITSTATGADNLGNHTATAGLNMNNQEIDSVSIFNLQNNNADAEYWAIYEKATTGDLWIQPSGATVPALSITDNAAGKKVRISDVYTLPNNDGATGQVLKTDGTGNVTWQNDNSGGAGAGEANVGANIGAGVGVYAGKADTTLQFKSFLEAGIIDITSDADEITITATEVDGSVTNEGSLTVGVGTASTSVVSSNTSGSTAVTLEVTGIATISETGNTITIGATEVDGSVTNEAFTIDGDGGDTEVISNQTLLFAGSGIASTSYSSAANTLTITATEVDGSLSNEGSLTVAVGTDSTSLIQSNTSGSTAVTLKEGTNITLTESGNTITISAAGGGGGEPSDGDKGDITVSGSGLVWDIDSGVVGATEVADNSLTATDLSVNVVSSVDGVTNDGGNIDLVASGIVSITPDDGTNTITIGATEVDGSVTNEGSLTVGVGTASDAVINSNTSGSTAVTLEVAGINTIAETGNTIRITATEVDGSVSNEGSLTVGAGTGTTSLINSNTSGSTAVTLEAGTNITLSESGNTITIAASGTGDNLGNHSATQDLDMNLFDIVEIDTAEISTGATTWKIFKQESAFTISSTNPNDRRFEISTAGAITFNEAYTFPTANGSTGQVLMTNGASTVAFTSSGGDVSGAFNNLQLGTGVVGATELASTTVTPGSYTAANITVDADGRITAAANGSGGGDNLGNHTATAGLNMNNQEIDSVSVFNLQNNNADAEYWAIYEKGTTGDLWIQPSGSATPALSMTDNGGSKVVKISNTYTLPTNAGSNGHVLTSNGTGGSTWSAVSLAPSVITPSQITTAQNNYAPTGWADATVVRLSCDADMDAIQGFSAETAGEIKTLQNVGSYPIIISPEHASSTAGNRVKYSDVIVIPPQEAIQIVYDGTASRWVPLAYNPNWWDSPNANAVYYDAPVAVDPEAVSSDLEMDVFGGIATNNALEPSATTVPFATWDMRTNSTTSGGRGLYYAHEVEETYYPGGTMMETRCVMWAPAAVSDATNDYYIFLRLADNPSSGFWDQNSSLGLRYTHDINSGKWQAYSRSSGGTDTVADTGVTFAANTKYDLRVVLNKANSEATYFINGTMVARITTNLPGSVSMGASWQIEKTAGSTNSQCRISRFVTMGLASQ